MNYMLTVLTHGDHDTLELALRSFAANVTPAPASAFLHDDGGDPGADFTARMAMPDVDWECGQSFTQRGFCHGTAACWREAAGAEWAFHLEHDFVFKRPVDLRQLADVLDRHPHLAQMALMRQPVNQQEIASGGLVAARAHDFEPRSTLGHPWLEQSAFWTTNPSLFRGDVARHHTWPRDPRCEGLMAFQLRDERPGTAFGFWGHGEVWVEHIGVRTGVGY